MTLRPENKKQRLLDCNIAAVTGQDVIAFFSIFAKVTDQAADLQWVLNTKSDSYERLVAIFYDESGEINTTRLMDCRCTRQHGKRDGLADTGNSKSSAE